MSSSNRKSLLEPVQKKNFLILLLLAAVIFTLYAWPNAVGSENISMVQVFEPDEANPLPYLFHMIKPGESFVQTIKNFLFYDYYPYGFLYFAFSALVILPLQWLGQLGNIPLVMLVLRQMISVLPMLAALLILVYIHDEFRTYRSFVLFILLSVIPAVVQSNLWWHPDGLVTFFVALTLFFLVRDRLRFGVNFYIAAVVCGFAIATKLIGLYFFLAVGLVLILGLIQKKLTFWKAFRHGLVFILLMAAAYLCASPFLLSHWERSEFWMTMLKQNESISSGYGIIYAKGLAASWPVVHQYYGEVFFILLCMGCMILGAVRGKNRLTYGLIFAWFIPLSVMVFFFSHLKFQYWMPAALPMISCTALLLPEKLNGKGYFSIKRWAQIAGVLLLVVQCGLFYKNISGIYLDKLHRAENNDSILFYNRVEDSLTPISSLEVKIYYDPRVYLPETTNGSAETTYDLLNYQYIQQGQFDVLLLMQQRILDYLNPNAEGIDASTFAEAQQFYRDAQHNSIKGYSLIDENEFGKIFVRTELAEKYYPGIPSDH